MGYKHLRVYDLPVTGSILEKALRFSQLLKGEDSKYIVGDGSLDYFKKWFGICKITISRDALSAAKEVVPLIKDYLACSFNRNEMSQVEAVVQLWWENLNYNMLFMKMLVS